MNSKGSTLADRLGMTVHVSVLRLKLEQLQADYPSPTASCVEDWLIDLANARGARIVMRPVATGPFAPPATDVLSNEELVVGICQLQCLDRPQMLRLAAQLISRGAVDLRCLCHLARQERVTRILADLARQALRVDPQHPAWQTLNETFGGEPRLRDTLLHWTRLAEPLMQNGRCNAAAWKLVA
jgi:hypothetical protein